MNAPRLIAAFIARRPLSWTFHVLVLAASIAVILATLLLRQAVETRLRRDVAGIDLVVGAKGSPLQLVMSSLMHVDAPTGNIPLDVWRNLEREPLVESAIPLALGDSVGDARIVGTTAAFERLYGASLAAGRSRSRPMEAVVGAEAAERLGLDVGDRFRGVHGLSGGDHAHDQPYRVVGVLEPTGAVIDRLVLTDLGSVWRLHGEEGAAEDGAAHRHGGPDADHAREITAVLVRYRSPLAAVVLPPRVAATPNLIGASPARETTRLAALTDIGAQGLTQLGGALLVLSGVGFVVAMASVLLGRRRDLAVLRALGMSPVRLTSILVAEGMLLGGLGGVAGVALGRLAAGWAIARAPGLNLALAPAGLPDLAIVGAGLGLGALAAVLPAVIAVRVEPAAVLNGAAA